jgi:hypothetical protein
MGILEWGVLRWYSFYSGGEPDGGSVRWQPGSALRSLPGLPEKGHLEAMRGVEGRGKLPNSRQYMDFFNDTRVRSAEDRHTRRRRRSGVVFDALSSIFHVSILIFALAVITKFIQLVGPAIMEW